MVRKKRCNYLQEYVSSTDSDKRGKPKGIILCMEEQLENTDTTSGRMFLAPVPDDTTNLECITIKCQLL